MKDIGSWICGFIDGEGCFHIGFVKRSKMVHNIEVRCSFSVSQRKESLKALELVKKYFNCGGIRYSNRDGTYKYEIRDVKQLEVIIKHFDKYKLETNKEKDYKHFKNIYLKVRSKKHLSKRGLEEIINEAYEMNSSGKRKYSKEYLLRLL